MDHISKSKFNKNFIFRPFKKTFYKRSNINPILIGKLRSLCNSLTAAEFTQCWKNYDKDNNGFLEGEQINSFLLNILDSVLKEQKTSKSDFQNLREEFLRQYDSNNNSKIELCEMAEIIISEENFLSIFRRNESSLNGYDFMKIWIKHAGYKNTMSLNEIQGFLLDLYQINNNDNILIGKIEEYAKLFIILLDKDQDGSLSFGELSRLLLKDENHLIKIKNTSMLSCRDFNNLFNNYDKDMDGTISGNELLNFTHDILQNTNENEALENPNEFEKFYRLLLKLCDKNKDGQFQKEEVALWLGVENK
ncbi:unnamed protein product [Gordionus sp. m RMFG-2023]|uniref:secretagogin-like n=1 Tax=Gordionus sp. m RMFG-2023 TaxID=3053472 RepID=UPI0030E2522E